MAFSAPIPFSPAVEKVEPEEPEIIQKMNATFDGILQRMSEDYGHAVRSVHAKGPWVD